MAEKKRNKDNTDSNEDDITPTKALGFLGKMWDSLDFGTILMGLLLVTGIYFAARTEAGQKMIAGFLGEGGAEKVHDFFAKGDSMIGKLLSAIGLGGIGKDAANEAVGKMNVNELQKAMQEHAGLSEAQAKILAPDEAGAKYLKDLVKNTGDNWLDAVNDKMIHALLTQKPEMVRKLIDSVPAGDASANASMGKMMEAVKTIVADRPRFEALLANKETYGVLVHAVSRFSGLPINEEKLGEVIKAAGFDKDGKPTKELNDLLTRLLADGGNAMPAITQFMASAKDSAAAMLTGLAGTFDASKLDKGQREMQELLQHNAAPVATLLSTLGADKSAQFMELLKSGDQAAIAAFALKEPAFKTFADTADIARLPEGQIKIAVGTLHGMNAQTVAAAAAISEKMPVATLTSFVTDEKGKPSLEKTVATALSAEGRDAIRAAGIANVAVIAQEQVSKTLTAKTLDAVLTFSEAIGTNENNKGDSARSIITGLTNLALNPSAQPLKNVKPEELATFFHDAKNVTAFGELLGHIDVKVLSDKQRIMVEGLRETWGNTKGGLAAVLGSHEGAELMLKTLNDPEFAKSASVCKPAPQEGLMTNLSNWAESLLAPGAVGDNMIELQHLREKFRVANCASDAAPTPTPAVRPQGAVAVAAK